MENRSPFEQNVSDKESDEIKVETDISLFDHLPDEVILQIISYIAGEVIAHIPSEDVYTKDLSTVKRFSNLNRLKEVNTRIRNLVIDYLNRNPIELYLPFCSPKPKLVYHDNGAAALKLLSKEISEHISDKKNVAKYLVKEHVKKAEDKSLSKAITDGTRKKIEEEIYQRMDIPKFYTNYKNALKQRKVPQNIYIYNHRGRLIGYFDSSNKRYNFSTALKDIQSRFVEIIEMTSDTKNKVLQQYFSNEEQKTTKLPNDLNELKKVVAENMIRKFLPTIVTSSEEVRQIKQMIVDGKDHAFKFLRKNPSGIWNIFSNNSESTPTWDKIMELLDILIVNLEQNEKNKKSISWISATQK